MDSKVKDFLMFRRTFTREQWDYLNSLVYCRENEKAAKLELDDSDIEIIVDRFNQCKFE